MESLRLNMGLGGTYTELNVLTMGTRAKMGTLSSDGVDRNVGVHNSGISSISRGDRSMGDHSMGVHSMGDRCRG
eukprot:2497959-Alexandrium_andersonii.AAC.1